MITLAQDCLVFKLASGESVPISPDMVSADLMGETAQAFDPEFIRDAARAVFYYFKHEQGRVTISVGEFASAMQQVLEGFLRAGESVRASGDTFGASDLTRLARESGQGCELFFFPRLRDEVRLQMQTNPRYLRFSGLRGCVKQLAGARRWGERCRKLEEQVVGFLRECLSAEAGRGRCAVLIR